MEGLQMNSAAVNLGAGGFVSYFEDGGATVVLGETTNCSDPQFKNKNSMNAG
jgi:hypothetical protein